MKVIPLVPRAVRSLCSAAAVAAAAVLAGCAAQVTPDQQATSSVKSSELPPAGATTLGARSKGVKIAMLLPLGGMDQTAAIAKSMKQAGEMALFERDSPDVQLVIKDDGGSAEGAKAATEEALKEGAEIILGPLFSSAVAGAAPVARAANTPLVAYSNDTHVAGRGVYLLSFLVGQEVERIVGFAAAQGKRRFAALVPDTAYGRIVEPAFREAVARAGGTIVALEFAPVQANGILEPTQRLVARIKQAEPTAEPVDALFLPGGQDFLPQVGPLLAYSGIDTSNVKLLGTSAWDYPNVGSNTAFLGGWYPSADPKGWQGFAERFAKTFGGPPPRLASLSYDAVNIAISLSTLPRGTRFTEASLTRSTGFNGVDGAIRLLPNGLSERALAVLEVQKLGTGVIDPAPATLGNPHVSAIPPRLN